MATVERSEFITQSEARRLLDVSKPTFSRIIQRAGVESFTDPTDARVLLYRRAAIEALLTPHRKDPEYANEG